ncbi:E3 ubiquitin-protein ligase BRE1A, partial [Ophiophagus hannah]
MTKCRRYTERCYFPTKVTSNGSSLCYTALGIRTAELPTFLINKLNVLATEPPRKGREGKGKRKGKNEEEKGREGKEEGKRERERRGKKGKERKGRREKEKGKERERERKGKQ